MGDDRSATTGRVERVLAGDEVADLDAYRRAGGFEALAAACRVAPDVLVDLVADAGLRGRGGAGFPTGTKWRTVAANRSDRAPVTVVVNAAEGEPGTFKDRTILRHNPYRVLEGAFIAARAVGAVTVVVAVKHTFAAELDRLARAIDEVAASGAEGVVPMRLVEGPGEYLFGEESALLEVVEGRQPFPRVTPPYRRGLDDGERDVAANPASSVELASGSVDGDASPALVDNVETLANVPGIVMQGAAWFRSVGTAESPGTIVCTVTGSTARHGVGEYAMGTPLSVVIDELGGGPVPGATLVGVLSGTASAVIPSSAFATPLAYETMAAAGSGLGSAGFIVLDDADDLVAVAHGVSRFLAVESCGQCEPCKLDGLDIAGHLDAIRRSRATAEDLDVVTAKLATVADGARCALGRQHQTAVSSLVALASTHIADHLDGRRAEVAEWPVVPVLDLAGDRVTLDESMLGKQPDWSFDAVDSGKTPAARLEDQPLARHPSARAPG